MTSATNRLLATLFACLLATPIPARAQAALHPDLPRLLAGSGGSAVVWVMLRDKAVQDPETALARWQASLPARTLARRKLRRTAPGLADPRDLPVAPACLDAIAATGVQPRVVSRWLNAVSARVDQAQLQALANLDCVASIRPVARSTGVDPSAQRLDAGASGYASGIDYGLAFDQITQIDLDLLHAQGFTGAGVVVGVLDTGFALTHDAFNQPGHTLDVLASYDFLNDDPVVGPEPGDDPDQHSHGTLIIGTLGAWMPGSLVGAAPDASYILCKTEDITAEYPAEEDFYVAGLEFAELNGADVVTSSLGYIDWYTQADLDGTKAPVTVAVNTATDNGVYCCTAAGNGGHDADPATSTLIAPADAFEVLSCGAVDVTGAIAWFSSDGPTADGRPKPEVLAMGDGTATVWPYDDVSYATASGTSLSTPLVAGVVACLAGAHPEWSVASMRERLMKSANSFGAPKPDPLFVTGWGLLDADNALALSGSFTDLGGALSGGAGLPDLVGSGSLVADEPVQLDLANGLPSGSASLLVGLSLLGAPFKGGTLQPSPDVIITGIPLDGAGGFSLAFAWVPGVPSGLSVYTQAWIADPGAPHGFSASQGLALTTP